MYTFAPTWSHRAISIHPVDTSYTYVSRYSDTTRYTDTHVSPPLRAQDDVGRMCTRRRYIDVMSDVYTGLTPTAQCVLCTVYTRTAGGEVY